MKNKLLLFVVLPTLAIILGMYQSNTTNYESSYEKRNSSNPITVESELAPYSIEETFDLYRLMKGEYTQEDWLRSFNLAKSIGQDRTSYNWRDLGPDNIGGRTRAIVADRNEINHLFAGSVSGGLYESINRSNTWHKVTEFDENLSISSICQTVDGTFYVATGHEAELDLYGTESSSSRGYGIYKSETDGSWSLISGTETTLWINEIVADTIHNVVWFVGSSGFKKYDAGTGTITNVSGFTGPCNSLSMSNDGEIIIVHSTGTGPKVMVSTNSGDSFSQVSASGETSELISMSGINRIEFAISHEKVDGKYRVYALGASNNLRGVWRSTNNGLTWGRIAPAYGGTPGGFSPFTGGSGGNGQGRYDNIITVVPGAPDRIIIGGVDCYSWSTSGNWEQISQWFLSHTKDQYVHADNHEMIWDRWGRLYIGNDGGVFFSDNANGLVPVFQHANRGYNVTQFYAIGSSAHGDVIGGSQDNGTSANYHTGTTWKQHKKIRGGDGFDCDLSFINRDILFTSIYHGGVKRSYDRGRNSNDFLPKMFSDDSIVSRPCTPGAAFGSGTSSGCGQFSTAFKLWENPNDLDSKDTVTYISEKDYSIGDTILIPTATKDIKISHISTVDIIFVDTLNYSSFFNDTIVVDEIDGSSYNLNVYDWDFIEGGDEISIGDSLLIYGIDINDTIIVASFITKRHYIGTNDFRPGVEIDMNNDSVKYSVCFDTVKIQDPFQSWFALDMGSNSIYNGIWITRNALRFGDDQKWIRIANTPNEEDGGLVVGDVSTFEFSKNGEYLFIGCWNGDIFRYSGFSDVYSPTGSAATYTMDGSIRIDTIYDQFGDAHITQLERITFFPYPITGLASGPIEDPDLLVVSLGEFVGNNKVQRSTNATGDFPYFESLDFPGEGTGTAAYGIPCYSVVIDRDDPNIILVGTEFGVYATETGGGSFSSWTNITGDFGTVPVYDLKQNWRNWDAGCKRPGEIYIGTHGAGIWSTDAYLSTPEKGDYLDKAKFDATIHLYPNPVIGAGIVEFYLELNEDITLQIFNLNGQMVNEITVANLQAGKNQIVFETSNLTKGTYILRLSSNSISETTKFIK